jgi:alginate O-acetyltransferase complex protein AlgJ
MRSTNAILIGLFMAMLWLPTLDSILYIDRTPLRSENRSMAVFPKRQPGVYGLENFIKGLEAYFNDHFGFRKCLVKWNNKLRWALFKDQTTRNVLIGKDGWLFWTSGQMIDHYNGQLQFTAEELHDWQVLLEGRRDWLARRGITYLFVVTPGKASIYPEFLPDWVVKVRPETKLDQFMAYMQEHSTVPVLDLRKALSEAKKVHPTYLKDDAHWNLFGGFIAYQEIMRTLDKQRPDLESPLSLSSFIMTNLPTTDGDLSRMLGISLVDSNSISLFPKPELKRFSIELPPSTHPKNPKFTRNAQAKDRVVVFHDSFGMSWVPLLGYHFNHVSYFWRYDFDMNELESEKPDIVISEMNELFFDIEDPKKLAIKEALN